MQAQSKTEEEESISGEFGDMLNFKQSLLSEASYFIGWVFAC